MMTTALFLLFFCPERAQFPQDWFVEIPKHGIPEWEILPQDAACGEVILSKRTDLGAFSNLAYSPFTLDGVEYASIEALWQSMKYPDPNLKNDERLKNSEAKWKWTRDQVRRMSGFESKVAGDHANVNLKKLGITWINYRGHATQNKNVRFDYKGEGQALHYTIIYAASQAKLKENPEIKELLKSTGDLILKPDHKQDPKSPPSYKYHEIYMKIRSEIQD